jgi:hypothetical protein
MVEGEKEWVYTKRDKPTVAPSGICGREIAEMRRKSGGSQPDGLDPNW